MVKRFPRLFIMMSIMLSFWTVIGSNVNAAEVFEGTVKSVLSGDRFEVQIGDEKKTIRLVGVSALQKGQPYCGEAMNYLKEVLEGQTVKIDLFGSANLLTQKANKQELSAYVYFDGDCINCKLIELGFAWANPIFNRRNENLLEAQATARQEGRGLWAAPDPIAPWLWLRRQVAIERTKERLIETPKEESPRTKQIKRVKSEGHTNVKEEPLKRMPALTRVLSEGEARQKAIEKGYF